MNHRRVSFQRRRWWPCVDVTNNLFSIQILGWSIDSIPIIHTFSRFTPIQHSHFERKIVFHLFELSYYCRQCHVRVQCSVDFQTIASLCKVMCIQFVAYNINLFRWPFFGSIKSHFLISLISHRMRLLILLLFFDRYKAIHF